MMPQRTFLMMLIVVCVTILCFVWMVRDSLCGLRLQQGNTVLVATLAYLKILRLQARLQSAPTPYAFPESDEESRQGNHILDLP